MSVGTQLPWVAVGMVIFAERALSAAPPSDWQTSTEYEGAIAVVHDPSLKRVSVALPHV